MDDLISRKAAIEAIMDADVCVTWNGVISDDDAVDIAIKSTKGSVISSIVNMPSAQADSKELSSTHKALDTISRQAAIDSICRTVCDNPEICESPCDEIKVLEIMPSAQPEPPTDDCISRHAAIDAVKWGIIYANEINTNTGEVKELCKEGNDALKKAVERIKDLPSAQPEKRTENTQKTHACDLISRQAAISAIAKWMLEYGGEGEERERNALKQAAEEIKEFPSAQQDLSEYSDKLWRNAYERGKAEALAQLEEAYISGETEAESRFHAQQRWIPCSERLPENGHYYLWCSDMGSVQSDYYWDGFENGMKYGYNIVAWMPLPEPYQAERRTDGTEQS